MRTRPKIKISLSQHSNHMPETTYSLVNTPSPCALPRETGTPTAKPSDFDYEPKRLSAQVPSPTSFSGMAQLRLSRRLDVPPTVTHPSFTPTAGTKSQYKIKIRRTTAPTQLETAPAPALPKTASVAQGLFEQFLKKQYLQPNQPLRKADTHLPKKQLIVTKLSETTLSTQTSQKKTPLLRRAASVPKRNWTWKGSNGIVN